MVSLAYNSVSVLRAWRPVIGNANTRASATWFVEHRVIGYLAGNDAPNAYPVGISVHPYVEKDAQTLCSVLSAALKNTKKESST